MKFTAVAHHQVDLPLEMAASAISSGRIWRALDSTMKLAFECVRAWIISMCHRVPVFQHSFVMLESLEFDRNYGTPPIEFGVI